MPDALIDFLGSNGSNPFGVMIFIIGHGGGLLLMPVMIWVAWRGWINWIQEKFKQGTPYVVLKIEIPQLHEQSMHAVEQIFVHLYGSRNSPFKEELYWIGFVQENFSFEIVSDGGYITFYVRTPTYYREMCEAAIYAQYPDASLSEAEDYSKEINIQMIDEGKVKVHGSELKLENDDTIPIKSWPLWEHTLPGKSIDPLASILEMMSRLQPGEKWWFQIMAQPADIEPFKERAQKMIDSIVEPDGGGGGDAGKLIKGTHSILDTAFQQVFPGDYATDAAPTAGLAERQRLTTPEREYVELIYRKMTRWPFHTKIRWMYFATPKLFDPAKGRRGMLGAMKQFKSINALTEGSLSMVDAGGLKWRKFNTERRVLRRARRMLWAYQSRDMSRGEHMGFILNTEELASIFHFPQADVRAPYITKATSRGVEPPTQLNYDESAFLTSDGGPIPNVNVASSGPNSLDPTVSQVIAQDAAVNTPSPQPLVAQAPIQPVNTQVNLPTNTEPEPPDNLPIV